MEEAADKSLPQKTEFTAGELDKYLDRLRTRVVEDLGAANRNVVSIYPEEYQPFQVRPHQDEKFILGYKDLLTFDLL